MDIRLAIEDSAREGTFATNIDDVIRKRVATDSVKPTILFTKWKPTVSLGISQSAKLDLDQTACDRYGIEVVRRKSGGQSVYLDDSYIVYSVIAKREHFKGNLDSIRETFCTTVSDVLTEYGVPSRFFKPDNIVVGDTAYGIKQLGNSGQIITKDSVVVHGSIRYEKKDIDKMAAALKINGHSLYNYVPQIERGLAAVTDYATISRSKLIESLANAFATYLGGSLCKEQLSDAEIEAAYTLPGEAITDKAHFQSKGICYLYLNGTNLVPELSQFLPYNKPSGT